MPVQTAQPNAWNLGRDCYFSITAPGGIPFTFPITEGSIKQETKEVTSRPLNGKPKFARIPDGWGGKFKFDRTGPDLDNLIAGQEATYWLNGNLFMYSIMQTIENPDGSISQYQFKNIAVHMDNAGDFKADGKVEQELSWRGPDRIRVL